MCPMNGGMRTMKVQKIRMKGNRPIVNWLVVAGLLSVTAYAVAEQLTVTTYYPSPRGVYDELRTVGNTFLALQPGGVADWHGVVIGTDAVPTDSQEKLAVVNQTSTLEVRFVSDSLASQTDSGSSVR